MSKRILICDDDNDILHVCRIILEKNGFKVFTSSDCETAFRKMDEIKPDLILMDIWIPEMGGEEATHRLKAQPDTHHIPVIIFSANKEIENIVKNSGADDFIAKPFELQTFLELIQHHLNHPAPVS